jgi:hypothetical protein
VGSRYREADFSKIRTRPIGERVNKVTVADFAAVPGPDPVPDPLEGAPDVLAARELRRVADAVAEARVRGRACVWMLGGHVVKTGCSPLLVDLVRRGYATHLAMNGATAIHDYEIARFGATSEDVAENLADASFGLWEETGREMNDAVRRGAREGWGMGEALARALLDAEAPHREASLLVAAYEADVPVTVHAAIGCEIIHQHPACDGAAIGATSHRDFRILAASLERLGDGGVVLNVGSAVILPEVFLKALTIARNLGHDVRNFTAVDLDMIRHYRPQANVIGRPVLQGGVGIHITGHHEILLPLLYRALRARER